MATLVASSAVAPVARDKYANRIRVDHQGNYWIAVPKTSSSFEFYKSTDGVTWTLALTMTDCLQVSFDFDANTPSSRLYVSVVRRDSSGNFNNLDVEVWVINSGSYVKFRVFRVRTGTRTGSILTAFYEQSSELPSLVVRPVTSGYAVLCSYFNRDDEASSTSHQLSSILYNTGTATLSSLGSLLITTHLGGGSALPSSIDWEHDGTGKAINAGNTGAAWICTSDRSSVGGNPKGTWVTRVVINSDGTIGSKVSLKTNDGIVVSPNVDSLYYRGWWTGTKFITVGLLTSSNDDSLGSIWQYAATHTFSGSIATNYTYKVQITSGTQFYAKFGAGFDLRAHPDSVFFTGKRDADSHSLSLKVPFSTSIIDIDVTYTPAASLIGLSVLHSNVVKNRVMWVYPVTSGTSTEWWVQIREDTAPVSRTFSSNYTIRQLISKTITTVFSLKSLVSNIISSIFNNKTNIAKNSSLLFNNTINSGVKDLSIVFRDAALLFNDVSVRYGLRSFLFKEFVSKHNSRTVVGEDHAL